MMGRFERLLLAAMVSSCGGGSDQTSELIFTSPVSAPAPEPAP